MRVEIGFPEGVWFWKEQRLDDRNKWSKWRLVQEDKPMELVVQAWNLVKGNSMGNLKLFNLDI